MNLVLANFKDMRIIIVLILSSNIDIMFIIITMELCQSNINYIWMYPSSIIMYTSIVQGN